MKQTQKQALLEYLKTHRCITNREAMLKLGILCCWKRIAELRADGYIIRPFTKGVKSRYGKARIVLYWYGGRK